MSAECWIPLISASPDNMTRYNGLVVFVVCLFLFFIDFFCHRTNQPPGCCATWIIGCIQRVPCEIRPATADIWSNVLYCNLDLCRCS